MKKNTKLLLAIVLALMPTFLLRAQYHYLEERFDAELSPSWSITQSDASSDKWTVKGGELFFIGSREGSRSELVSAKMDLTSHSAPILKFRYKLDQYDANVDKISVFVFNSDKAYWVELMSDSVRHKQYVEYELSLPDTLISKEAQLKFVAENRGGNGVVLDDVLLVGTDVCIVPPADFRVSSISNSAAKFMWNTNESAINTHLIVANQEIVDFEKVDKSTIVKDTVLKANAVVNTFVLDKLKSATKYFAYVNSDCGYGDISKWSSLNFVTLSDAVSIPFQDDLETLRTGEWGLWSVMASDENSTPTISHIESINGQKSATLSFYLQKDKYAYFQSPELNVADVKELALSFDVFSSEVNTENSSQIEIGVMTNIKDVTTFTPIHTVAPTMKSTWQTISISFSNYVGDAYGDFGKHIVFRVGSLDKLSAVWIDNIRIETAGCFSPQLLTVDKLYSTAATIVWKEMGKSNQWVVRLAGNSLSATDLDKPSAADITTNTNKVELNGLVKDSVYYVYVKSECGKWSDPLVFKTKNSWPIGYVEGLGKYVLSFPKDIVKGQMYSNGEHVVNTTSVTVDSWENSGSGSVGSIRMDVSDSYSTYIILPEIEVDKLSKVQLGLDVKLDNRQTAVVVGVCTEQDINTCQMLDTLYPSVLNKFDNWIVDFSKYDGVGKFIAIKVLYSSTAETSAYSKCYLDNLSIQNFDPCIMPQSFVVSRVGADYAVLKWKLASVSVPEYELQYKMKSDVEWQSMIVSNVDSCRLNNLVLNRSYEVRLRMKCPNSAGEPVYTAWTEILSFDTPVILEVPYMNDFSTSTTEGMGVFPEAWTCFNERSGHYGPDSYVPYISGEVWKDVNGNPLLGVAPKSLLFNTMTYYYAAFAVMPMLIETEQISNLAVEFDAYSSKGDDFFSTCEHEIEVGVMVDPKDASTFCKVGSFSFSDINALHHVYVSLKSYNGEGRYIAFKVGKNSTSVNVMIDNLRVDKITECALVSNLTKVASEPTSLTIDWVNGNEEVEWNVGLFNHEVSSEDIDLAKDNLFTSGSTKQKPLCISDLQPNTDYWIAIQAKTANCVGPWSAVYRFNTDCPTSYDLPFEEKFNNYEGSDIPRCWVAKAGYDMPYLPKLRNSSSRIPDVDMGNIGGKFVEISGVDKYASYVILPPLNGDITKLQFDFVAYTQAAVEDPAVFEIGVMDSVDQSFLDPTISGRTEKMNESLFTVIEKIVIPESKKWIPYSIVFDNYTKGGNRIAIRVGNHYSGRVYFDNFKVQPVPLCSKIRDLQVNNITKDAATFTWSAKNETEWNIRVSDVMTSPEDPNAKFVLSVDGITQNPYSVSSLLPNTRYWVYIQRVNKVENCVGDWSNGFTFVTKCEGISNLAFVDDFESNRDEYGENVVPRCWSVSGTNKVLPYVSKPNFVGLDNPNQMVLTMENASFYSSTDQRSTIYTAYACMPELLTGSVNDVILAFKAAGSTFANKGGFFEVGVMSAPDDPSTFKAVYSDSVKVDPVLGSLWKEFKVNFRSYVCDDYGEVGKYIAFRVLPGKDYDNQNRVTNNVIYIDSVAIEQYNACAKPMSFAIQENKPNAVTLSWATSLADRHRLVIYRDMVADPFKDTIVEGTSVVLNNMPANVAMTAKLAPYCDKNKLGEWSDALNFRTAGCGVTLPYCEGFEFVDHDGRGFIPKVVPNCYNVYSPSKNLGYGNSGDAADVMYDKSAYVEKTTYVASGDNALLIGGDAYAFLPQISGCTLNEIALRMHVYSFAEGVEVGVISNVKDITTYKKVKYFSLSNRKSAWVEVDFADLVEFGLNSRIAIKAVALGAPNNFIYIDNIFVDKSTSVWAPSLVTLVAAKNTSLSVKWNQVGKPEKWQVAYGIKDTPIASMQILDSNKQSVDIINLKQNTSYDLYVRSIIGRDTSVWSDVLSVRTYSDAATLPYSCDFADASENAKWTFVSAKPDTKFPHSWTIGAATAYNDANSLYISNNGSDYQFVSSENPDVAWAYRTLDIDKSGTYIIELMAKGDAAQYSVNNFAVVGLMPASYIPDSADVCKDIYSDDVFAYDKVSNPNLVITRDFMSKDWVKIQAEVYIDKPGYYNVLCRWENGLVSTVSSPIAIDDVKVYENLCPAPRNLSLSAVSDTFVTVSWDGGVAAKWNVMVSKRDVQDPTTLSETDIIGNFKDVSVTTYNVTLSPKTRAFVYVSSACSAQPAEWVKVEVNTVCGKYSVPYTQGFDNVSGGWSYNIECWMNSYGSEPYGESDWNTGVTFAKFSSSDWLIMPMFDKDIDKLQIKFDVSHTCGYNTGADNPKFEVGVMSNPFDKSTYKTLKEFSAIPVTSYSTPLTFVKFYHNFMSTPKEYKFIVFRSDNASVFNLDNVVVELTPDCVQPFDLSVSDVTDNSATINWNSTDRNAKFKVVLALEDTLSSVSLDKVKDVFEVVGAQTYTATGLKHSTVYYAYVGIVCSNSTSWSMPIKLATLDRPLSLPYIENFDGVANSLLPNRWLRSNDNINRSMSGNELTILGSDHYEYDDFAVFRDRGVNNSNALSSELFDSRICYEWAISPEFVINEQALLSFDLNLQPKKQGVEYRTSSSYLKVLISRDNGKTWDFDNAVQVGDLSTATYSSADFFGNWKKVYLDMLPYIGDTIRFAVYYENKDWVPMYLNIDNFSLKPAVVKEIDDIAFENHDYGNNGFTFDYSQLRPGVNSAIRYQSDVTSNVDSIIKLNLNVYPTIRVNLSDYICGGDASYDKYGFSVASEGTYVNRGVATTGADSITTLVLKSRPVNEIQRITHNMCTGSYFEFAGKQLTEAGTYTDTLLDSYGCDSIVELTLIVSDKIHVSIFDTICHGTSITFGDRIIFDAGVYVDTAISASKCDSITTMTLTVLGGKSTTIKDEIVEDKLPYVYEGQVIVPEGTKPGLFRDTILVNVENSDCSDSLIFEINVLPLGSGVESVYLGTIEMTPNPVVSGSELNVSLGIPDEWVDADFMQVEVISMYGTIVDDLSISTNKQFKLKCNYAAGTYIVRVTIDNVTVACGKVVVL